MHEANAGMEPSAGVVDDAGIRIRDFTAADCAAATTLWQRCRLLALVETRLRQRGGDKVNLLIEPDNDSVAAFYAEAGYARDPLIFMKKWL